MLEMIAMQAHRERLERLERRRLTSSQAGPGGFKARLASGLRGVANRIEPDETSWTAVPVPAKAGGEG